MDWCTVCDSRLSVWTGVQYADPVADLLDKWGVFQARLFRDSCVFHHGSYVKVSSHDLTFYHIGSPCYISFASHNLVTFIPCPSRDTLHYTETVDWISWKDICSVRNPASAVSILRGSPLTWSNLWKNRLVKLSLCFNGHFPGGPG